MKKFIRRLILFLLPFVIWTIIEAVLPFTTFTHRHYEAIEFKTEVPHQTKNYPNITSSMDAVGDLCHHSKNAVIKKENWKTDKLGFRNDAFIEQADILLIGDSFTQGSSLNAEETITNKVKSNQKIKIYNMAPSSLSEFDKLLKSKTIKKPKLLIFEIAERNVPHAIKSYDIREKSSLTEKLNALFGIGNFNVYLDKAFKYNSVDWLKARIYNKKGTGIPGIQNSKMFFLVGSYQKNRDYDLIATANTIISYKKYCESLGIKFVFLPMPNKESVYYDFVPLAKQPDYLFKLDSILKKSNVATINTLKIYNDYRMKNKKLLYHLDDTHWNSNATEIIADEIIKYIRILQK